MNDNYITCQDELGSINISEDVIHSLVRTAVSEVEGVAALANTAGGELAELLGLKTVTKGVKVQLDDNQAVVDVIISVCYGSNILKVAKEVQEKVTGLIQNTTGFERPQVNVHVSGLSFEKDK
ncbi:MAG: Asp23/Gls24 family envelope stress response protein [Oscillospiraceae bacterium]|nr:Asp23/Gls24 family envelope stress response protein [Oscillospiraceae bacterium]